MSSVAMLSGVLEGVASLLKVRLTQVLEPLVLGGAGSLVLSFRLLNLLAFYDATLRASLMGGSSGSASSSASSSSESALADVLADARARCQRAFEAGLRSFGEALVAAPPAYSMDLAVSTHAPEVL
jgi:hypothetical protein